VQLREFPNKAERASVSKESQDSALDGVSVENVTPELAQQLKLSPATKGVVVDEVSPASRAADAGLRPGDVIQEANHRSVKSVSDFRIAVSARSKDDAVLLLVNREGSTIFLTV
jgi:serine protease Do